MAYGYLDNSSGLAGGLLSDAYIDPMTAGFSAASQALLPLMGATRTPTGGIGAALAAAGSGYSTGVTAARQQNLQMTPLLIQQIRMNGIAQRHPDWFGQKPPADPSALDTQAAAPPPPGPSPLQQSQDLTAQTGFAPGGSLAQQSPLGALPGQQIASAPLPTQAQPANALRGGPGQPSGNGLPMTAQDAEDYLFLHPEMKEIVAKNFAGPSDLSRLFSEQKQFPPGSPQYNAYQLAIAKAQGIDVSPNPHPGVPVFRLNPTTGLPEIAAQNPILGPGQIPSADGTAARLVTGYVPNAAAVHGAEQGAILNRERALARTNYGIEFGGGPNGDQGGPLPPPQKTSGGYSVGGPVQAGGGASAAPPNTPAAINPWKPFQTPTGSIVPPVTEATPIDQSGANLKDAIPRWNATKNEWYKQAKDYNTAEQRALAIADAFGKTETGEWATDKVKFAAALKSAGIDIGDKLGDVAAVQTALKDNWSAVLEMMKGVSTRGPTEREIMASSKNFANPDLQPEANHKILSQVVGGLRWDRQMIQDYQRYGARMGWKDPADFQVAWAAANPLQSYIDKTEASIPAFKGSPGNAGPAAPSAAVAPPPSAAVQHLQMNPRLASDFDKKYGAGAAAKVLGK